MFRVLLTLWGTAHYVAEYAEPAWSGAERSGHARELLRVCWLRSQECEWRVSSKVRLSPVRIVQLYVLCTFGDMEGGEMPLFVLPL